MKRSDRRLQAVDIVLLVVILQGCATIGEDDFGCPGRPHGVVCASATDIYELTENTDDVAPTSLEPLGDDPSAAGITLSPVPQPPLSVPVEQRRGPLQGQPAPQPPPAKIGPLLHTAARAQSMELIVDKPVPVRAAAQVMRVWIGPWEDDNGVLHVGGYVFVEVEARRWAIGGRNQVQPVRMLSIQDEAPVTASVGGTPPPPSGNAPLQVGLKQSPKRQ